MADGPANDAPYRLLDDVEFGDDVVVHAFTNLYGCRIGDDSRIGPFVEIQRGASIGANCKIQSHTFICDGVTIEDDVFVGHGVMFVNDKYPRATAADGRAADRGRLGRFCTTVVERGASLGSGAVVLGGVRSARAHSSAQARSSRATLRRDDRARRAGAGVAARRQLSNDRAQLARP